METYFFRTIEDKDLRTWMDNAKGGIIYVSFGSVRLDAEDLSLLAHFNMCKLPPPFC